MSSSEKKHGILLVFGMAGECGDPWLAKVLLSFRKNVIESKEGQVCTVLQYTEVPHLIDMVDHSFGCVCPRWSTDVEMVHRPR